MGIVRYVWFRGLYIVDIVLDFLDVFDCYLFYNLVVEFFL